jgi:hypothetical protein
MIINWNRLKLITCASEQLNYLESKQKEIQKTKRLN